LPWLGEDELPDTILDDNELTEGDNGLDFDGENTRAYEPAALD